LSDSWNGCLAVKSQKVGGEMNISRPLLSLAIPIFLTCGLSAAQTPTESSKQENAATLKAINTPTVPYPEEAIKKGIEGKVTLSIVVDATGNVSQAKALSGPQELVPAAIASVRMWQYEPPASAPVTRTVEVSYGFPKECPGPISDRGEVEGNGRLFDKNGKLVAVVDDEQYPSPPYPEQERKSGVAGKMILSISLNSDGHVKDIHAVNSLSPELDKAAIDMVRPWKFKRCQDEPSCGYVNSKAPLEDLRLQFTFRAVCDPLF
jgi:TonB family protein